MQSILSTGYSVHFNSDGYAALNTYLKSTAHSTIFILVDTNTNDFCSSKFLSNIATENRIEIIEIEPSEETKNIETCVELWSALSDLGADRKSLLLNLGGGVVTDIGGFVAATFKRGISFINIPTSLLSMVDAAIGSKNGVDLGNLKNQIGTITSPQMVIIDTDFLETLPQNQMRSGLAEMLKHGLIANHHYWDKFQDLAKIDYADFDSLIAESVEIKNNIVLQDPTEEGMRKALNFGHTLGHAIESHFMSKETTLLHGEAIAIGMVLESFLSFQLNFLSKTEYLEIKNQILAIFGRVEISQSDITEVLNLLKHDKKNEYGKVKFALLDGIGNAKIDQEVDNEIIIASFDDYKNSLFI
ncbi:3-dehydroquinate synthase [Flavobacterium ardleyense]|uniref:3-dehydroquinate synthase n=1 Tax=Flavobacterium ardleyense TaxID=2038737 RepID=UPI00298C63D5|nr:3-dehydroquinate synthase [Flavobacterium ardleyense]